MRLKSEYELNYDTIVLTTVPTGDWLFGLIVCAVGLLLFSRNLFYVAEPSYLYALLGAAIIWTGFYKCSTSLYEKALIDRRRKNITIQKTSVLQHRRIEIVAEEIEALDMEVVTAPDPEENTEGLYAVRVVLKNRRSVTLGYRFYSLFACERVIETTREYLGFPPLPPPAPSVPALPAKNPAKKRKHVHTKKRRP